MLGRKSKNATPKALWALAIGTGVGLAAGLVIAGRRGAFDRFRPSGVDRALVDLEEQVVELLGNDEILGHRAIEVAALSAGIIELTGAVRSREEAERAVEIARRGIGVRTVLNRLELEATNVRRTRRTGDTGSNGTHWYGMGVGMGRRRQGAATDPDRRDDHQDMISRDLSLERVDVTIVDEDEESTDTSAGRGEA